MEQRIKSIDILRGIAISCMIIGHVHQRWTWGLYETWFGYFIVFIGLWSPPFFVLISGISFYILINNRVKKESQKKVIISEILKRAIFIFMISTIFNVFFGFLLNMQAELTFGFLYWSIFQLISISMIAFFFIPFMRKNFRYITYLSLFIIVFLTNHLIVYYNITVIYFLAEAAGPFPFLPWSNMFLLGIFFGDLLINLSKETLTRYLKGILVIGIIFFVIWLFWLNLIKYMLIDRFVEGIGLFFILFSVFYYISDMKQKESIAFKTLIRWGTFSFSIYYYHYLIIWLGLHLFPLIIPGWTTVLVTIPIYILLLILVFFIIEVSLRLWKKIDFKYGIEWFMRKFSQTSLFKKNRQEKVNI